MIPPLSKPQFPHHRDETGSEALPTVKSFLSLHPTSGLHSFIPQNCRMDTVSPSLAFGGKGTNFSETIRLPSNPVLKQGS